MTLAQFIELNLKDYFNPDIFSDNEKSLEALTNNSTAVKRIDQLARLFKELFPIEQFDEICKRQNYSSSVVGLSDKQVTLNAPIYDPNAKDIYKDSLTKYFTYFETEAKKNDPNFNIETLIDQAMLTKDQYVMDPEQIEHKVIDQDIQPVLEKVETYYPKDSKEYKNISELINFANENIKKSELPEPNQTGLFDGISVRNKARAVKERMKNSPNIKNTTHFNTQTLFDVDKDCSLVANFDFIKNSQAVKECSEEKLVLSPEYKQFLKTFIPKMIESNNVSSGEEAFKYYAFKNYNTARKNVITSVDEIKKNGSKEEIDKLLVDLGKFKEEVKTTESLLEESKATLSKNFVSSGNVDVLRTKDIPVKYRFDILSSSHLCAMSFVAGFIKENNLNLDEFLENPLAYKNLCFKSMTDPQQYLNNKFVAANNKAELISNWLKGDDHYFGLFMAGNFDYRPFEALAMCEPNKEYREKGMAAHSLGIDTYSLAAAQYKKDIVTADYFKNPKSLDDAIEVFTNMLVMDREDINADSVISGILPSTKTLVMGQPLNRTQYLRDKGQKDLNEYYEQFIDELFAIKQGIENADTLSMINMDTLLISAQKTAISLCKANNIDTKNAGYEKFINFAKDPIKAFEQLYEFEDGLHFASPDLERKSQEIGKSDAIKELELEREIDKTFTNILNKDQLNELEYTLAYQKFIVDQLAKRPKEERTEENLADLMRMTDKVMEEQVFPKHNKEFKKELKLGGLENSMKDLKKLSRKAVSAYGAIKEAREKIEDNLQNDEQPKNEKVFRSAAALKNLQQQHKDRPFSLFHIPSYYREYKAIKNLKQQIIDSGITRETLENAQRALDENPELMAAFDASNMATKLFSDAKDECLRGYRANKEEIHRNYNLNELNARLQSDLNRDFAPRNDVPVSQKVVNKDLNKVIEIDQPNNQELKH